MKLYEKALAFIAIPIGGFFLLFGLLGIFMDWSLHLHSTMFICCGLIIAGWSLCFTFGKLWRISNKYDELKTASELTGRQYEEFIHKHPEYIEADAVFRKKEFQKWKAETSTHTSS